MPARSSAQTRKRIYIVDRDRTVCETLGKTFAALGYEVRLAASPQALAAAPLPDINCCVLVDVSFTDQSAFDLQRHYAEAAAPVALVFMTAQGDIAMAVNAMKRGAVDFLTKPLRMSELLPAVDLALLRSAQQRDARKNQTEMSERVARLTPRESAVLALVLQGKRNKQIADQLQSQESTVKVHRSRLMRKLEVRTLAELLRAAPLLAHVERDGPGRSAVAVRWSVAAARGGAGAESLAPQGVSKRFRRHPARNIRE